MKKVLIFGVILVAALVLAGSFKDVPSDHWAAAYISKLVNAGIVNGYPDGTFKGRRYVTRYEMTAFISRTIDYMEKVLNVQMSSLKNDIALVNAKTKTLQGDVEVLKRSLTALAKTVLKVEQQAKSSEAKAEVESLQEKLDNFEKSFMRFKKGTYTDVKLLKESVTNLNQKVSDVEKKVKGVESRLDDTVSYLYDEIDNTKEQVDLVTEGLQAIRDDMESEISDKVSAVDKKVSDLEKKLSELKYSTLTDMGFVKKGVMGNAKNIGMLLKKTSALQNDVIDVKKKVDWVSSKVLENEQVMKIYKGKIEGLETRVTTLSQYTKEIDAKATKNEEAVKSAETKALIGIATGATGSILAVIALLKVFNVF